MHNEVVWFSLFIVLVIVVLAIGIIWLIASWRRPQGGFVDMYIDSVKSLRSTESTPTEFTVAHEDIALGDVFSSFTPYDGDAYLTPEELNAAMTEITASTGVEKVKRVADRWKKEHHAA